MSPRVSAEATSSERHRKRVPSRHSKKKAKVKVRVRVIIASLLSLWYGEEVVTEIAGSIRRKLSINLGGGECTWIPAIQHTDEGFPTNEKLTKTIIAGYPSGDKRVTFLQLEGLTGLSARDEWEFAFIEKTNQPFIKANYPHHEGIWGWGDIGDQVVMVVSDIKRVMIEYHDILWDIGYAQTFQEAYERMNNLYTETDIYIEGQVAEEGVDENAPVADFLVWRDMRVFDEIHWYSFFIDYYMESGLMRDMFNHQLTVPSQWSLAMLPNWFTKYEMRHGRFVDENEVVTPSYDPMCATLTKGCYPVLVIDPDKLVDPIYGPVESRKLAKLVEEMEGFDDWLIDEEAWECIWSKLIQERKGITTFLDKEIDYNAYTYSFEIKNEMWHQINRLITKYEAQTDRTATDLVKILRGHRDGLGVDTPVDPISYEELMSYHLALPPFFPNQKPFQSDDDFFVRTHEKFANPEAWSIESIIDRRRAWFEEEMEKKKERYITVKYYDATGWTALPTQGLDSKSPYLEETTKSIDYERTTSWMPFAGSGRTDNVAALFQGNLRTDVRTEKKICVKSIDVFKLFIDDKLSNYKNERGRGGQSKSCVQIETGVHKFHLEYLNPSGNSKLILQFRGDHGNRVVPPRAWASAEGARKLRDLTRLNDLLEEDLQNLKETDIMGPWTRAEFNRRKEASTGPSASQQQQSKKHNFAVFDQMLSEKMKKKRATSDT